MSGSDLLQLPSAPPKPRRGRWRRRLIVFLLLILVAVVYLFVLHHSAKRELAMALAEADSLDPGWRIEELEAKRLVIPDEGNSALKILSAAKQLPKAWPPWSAPSSSIEPYFEKKLTSLLALEQLSTPQIKVLTETLMDARAALETVRSISELPYGRYPISYAGLGILIEQPALGDLKRVRGLISYDILLRAQKNDIDGALASCRALVNAGRSIGDEPLFFSQFRRMDMSAAACRDIERALAQGEPSAAALEALQRLLEREEAEPLFLIGARGNRALWDKFFEAVESNQALPNSVQGSALAMVSTSSRTSILQANTQLVEIAKRPVEEQIPQLRQARLFEQNNFPILARTYFAPKVQRAAGDLSQRQIRSPAELRCAIVALAMERYRKSQGGWPARLDDLVPKYLARVLTDPYDGQPLRFRRVDKGVLIYSVGPDGQDHGGIIDRTKPNGSGTDLGFQLWDVGQRRRAARE